MRHSTPGARSTGCSLPSTAPKHPFKPFATGGAQRTKRQPAFVRNVASACGIPRFTPPGRLSRVPAACRTALSLPAWTAAFPPPGPCARRLACSFRFDLAAPGRDDRLTAGHRSGGPEAPYARPDG
jgi:hypothetical protein